MRYFGSMEIADTSNSFTILRSSVLCLNDYIGILILVE